MLDFIVGRLEPRKINLALGQLSYSKLRNATTTTILLNHFFAACIIMFSKLFAVKRLNLLDVSKTKLIFQKSDRPDTCKIWGLQQFQNLFTYLMKSLPGDAKNKI